MIIFVLIIFDVQIETRILGDDKNTFYSRFYLNEIAMNMVKAHPIFGVGGNTFRSVIHSYTYSIDRPWVYLDVVHNQYLLIFAECGILGLISFLWLMLAFMRESWECSKNKDNEFVQIIGMGITAGFLAFIVHGLSDFYIASHLGLSSIYLLCAVCSAGKKVCATNKYDSNENCTRENIYKSQ